MKVQEANKIAEKQLEKLAEALELGKSESFKKYLSVMARFHNYSMRNQLLILSQQPDATKVAGFKSWTKLGRWVKKGERGIVIIIPLPLSREVSADEDKIELAFRAGYVFDVSQTEGEELPEVSMVAGDPGSQLERLKQFAVKENVAVEYSCDLGGAEGISKGGSIVVLEGLEPANEFAVLVHELAHEVMHQGGQKNKVSKRVLETEAEAVAFVVSSAVGLDCGTACSDYIQLYRGDVDTLQESLTRIQQVASEIISAIVS